METEYREEYSFIFPEQPPVLRRTYSVRCRKCNDITHSYVRGDTTTICVKCELQNSDRSQEP